MANINFSDDMINKLVENEFKTLDTDNSGFIDFQEYKASVQKKFKEFGLGDLEDATVEAQLKSIDKDGDFKVSREEYKIYFRQLMGLN